MNHCESYEPLLDAFTEGDLFMEDLVWVQKHLNECPKCRAYVDDLIAIRAAFPTVEETELPLGFTASVMGAVVDTPQAAVPVTAKAKPASASKKTPWVKVLSGLAACCAIVLLAQGVPQLAGGGTNMPSRVEEAVPESEALYYTADSVAETGAEAKMMAEPAEAAPAEETLPIGAPSTKADADAPMSPYRIILEVDADYIGDLLDDYLPLLRYEETVTQNGKSVSIQKAEYELTMAQYDILLDQLETRREMPVEKAFDTDSSMVLVIVRQ